jgi:hypothetical protein
VVSLGAVRRPVAAARRTISRWPRALRSQPGLLVVLTLVALLYTVAATTEPAWFPLATATLWILLAGFFLRLRYLMIYYAVLTTAVVVTAVNRPGPAPQPGVVLTLGVTGLLVLVYAGGRERVGVQGLLGESMLVDLRDRLRAQAVVPELSPGWQVETVLQSAYGDSFSGDFLVASMSADGRWLEIVLVDVSGKGQAAGTRALLLSGAFGGLLGAMPRDGFLDAANRYLLRQRWPEGFATAVHVAVDQCTGDFELRGAGHPPAAHWRSGSGRWQVVDSAQGPLLGVVEGPDFPAHRGRIERGDALLLYTDGLVERRDRDIGLGIDRLVGAAERAMTDGFTGGGRRIVQHIRAAGDDDRALVLLWRS